MGLESIQAIVPAESNWFIRLGTTANMIVGTCTLMDLPNELLVEILCKWLDLKSLVQLDSATCNHPCRSTLLAFFSSRQCVFNSTVDFENGRAVNWFRSRRLHVSSIRIRTLCPELVDYLRKHSPSIRHVKCQSSKALSAVAIHVRNLVTLTYESSAAVSELSDILWVNSHLKELRLEGVRQFNLESLDELSLPHLSILLLCYTPCNDLLLGRFVQTTRMLQKINIGHCLSVTDAGVIAVAQHCPQLRSLGLCALPISDGALLQLTQLCPCITCLDLHENDAVTDLGVRAIAENLKSLHCLNIEHCMSLTDVSIKYLTQYSALTLLALHTSGIPTIRVHILVGLLQKCSHLQTLYLDCDLAAYYLEVIPHMRNLRTLSTYSMFCDDALCLIAQHCKKMQGLAIYSSHMYEKPLADGLTVAANETRILHCVNQISEFEDRLYTEKGLMALLDGLPQLRALDMEAKEVQQGLLTPLAQGLWRRLRPLINFGFAYFKFDLFSE